MSVLLSGGWLCGGSLGMHMALRCPLAGRLANRYVLLLQALTLAAIAAGAVVHAWLRLRGQVQQWGCSTPAPLHGLKLRFHGSGMPVCPSMQQKQPCHLVELGVLNLIKLSMIRALGASCLQ